MGEPNTRPTPPDAARDGSASPPAAAEAAPAGAAAAAPAPERFRATTRYAPRESRGSATSSANPTAACSARNARSASAVAANATAIAETWKRRGRSPSNANQLTRVVTPRKPRSTSKSARAPEASDSTGRDVTAYTAANATQQTA